MKRTASVAILLLISRISFAVNPAIVASSTSPAVVVFDRDPVVSPMERAALQAKADAERAELQAEKDKLSKTPVSFPPIETKISDLLHGTMIASSKKYAIIGAEKMVEGQHFKVADYPQTVLILKITESRVRFRYNKREFWRPVSLK